MSEIAMENPYAAVADAVRFAEAAMLPVLWAIGVERGETPRAVVERIARNFDKAVNVLGWPDELGHVMSPAARAQIDDPLFLKWVAGKMGEM